MGQFLVPKLLKLGHDVYCVEQYFFKSMGKLGVMNHTLFLADIRDSYALTNIMMKVKPEIVIHLAAMTAVAYSYDHFYETTMTNYIGTINMAEIARLHCPNLKQFIAPSSAEAYGVNKILLKKETDPLVPNSPYAVSKVASEHYLTYMNMAYDFPVTIFRPFNCYDEKTEILTNQGWKYFYQLSDELVGTLNPFNNKLEYQKPISYFKSYYSGNMVKVSGNQLDLLVTPNHRMWIKKRWGREYYITFAQNLLRYNGKRCIKFQLSLNWDGVSQQNFKLEERIFPMDLWIDFMAWWLSEGCIDKREKRYEVDIRQLNEGNLEEIRQLISNLGIKQWNCKGRARFKDRDIYLYLKQFGHAKDKFVPEYIKNLSRPLIRRFLNTYQKGDGSRGYYKGYEVRDNICSISKRMLNDLQELVLKAGWASSLNGRFLTIARTRTEVCPRNQNNFIEVPYHGMIYCVNVPNSLLIVRRNGKVVICGNSFGRKDSNWFVVERTIWQMLRGQPVCNLGDPEPIRDFLYIENHADAYIKALNNPKAIGETFNLSTGVGVTIKQLANLIRKLTNFKGKIKWATLPRRPLDIMHLIGSNDKLKSIGWKEPIPLAEGLNRTIDYWKHKIEETGDYYSE